MLISEIGIRGFRSFGNNEQVLKLNTERGELILASGGNGNGKCVDKKTCIDIEIDDLELSIELVEYLEKTDMGRVIFSFIKENNIFLYDKIRNFKENI